MRVLALIFLLSVPVFGQEVDGLSALSSNVGRENARAMGQPSEVPVVVPRQPTLTVHDGGLVADDWTLWRMWTCLVFGSWITGCGE